MKQFGPFALDTVNQCLWHAGERIAVPPKPFGVLRYLVEHPGRLVSHDELLDALWSEIYVQPQILRTYMNDLRRVLNDDARNPRYIESVPKRGYRFVASIAEDASSKPAAAPVELPPPAPMAKIAGRELELATLRKQLQCAAGGARQIVFISGEAGIGKTALVDEFIGQAEENACIAHGECVPGFTARQDYCPVLDALRRLACKDSEFKPLPSASPTPLELCAALEAIPRSLPLLLVIEDLQHADEATLQLISALARRRHSARLMIVATFTAQYGSAIRALDQLTHELRLRRLCCELCLPRLPRPAIAALLRAHLATDALPHGLAEFIYQHSEGNPRFAIAIAEHLVAEKLLAPDGPSAWQLRGALESGAAPVPAELARMIELEIEHLAQPQQKLLEAASLSSVAFPAWAVAAALGEAVAETEEACDELSRSVSFVKRAGEDELPDGTRSSFYVFAHTLYREVLYQRQSAARRALRHRRLADRLREMFRGREDLIAREAAAHYEAAGDWANAIAMMRLAARRALDLRALGEAADLEAQIARATANLPVVPIVQAAAANHDDNPTLPLPIVRPAPRFSN